MNAPLWFRQILTEDDANSVLCPVRVIGASGALSLIGGALFVAITKGSFDAMGMGTGIAAIAGAVGVGAGAKAKMGA